MVKKKVIRRTVFSKLNLCSKQMSGEEGDGVVFSKVNLLFVFSKLNVFSKQMSGEEGDEVKDLDGTGKIAADYDPVRAPPQS